MSDDFTDSGWWQTKWNVVHGMSRDGSQIDLMLIYRGRDLRRKGSNNEHAGSRHGWKARHVCL